MVRSCGAVAAHRLGHPHFFQGWDKRPAIGIREELVGDEGVALDADPPKPTDRSRAVSVCGNDGWARCRSKARSTRSVRVASEECRDTGPSPRPRRPDAHRIVVALRAVPGQGQGVGAGVDADQRPGGPDLLDRLSEVEAGATTDVQDALAGAASRASRTRRRRRRTSRVRYRVSIWVARPRRTPAGSLVSPLVQVGCPGLSWQGTPSPGRRPGRGRCTRPCAPLRPPAPAHPGACGR
jgi:hypothetical protein